MSGPRTTRRLTLTKYVRSWKRSSSGWIKLDLPKSDEELFTYEEIRSLKLSNLPKGLQGAIRRWRAYNKVEGPYSSNAQTEETSCALSHRHSVPCAEKEVHQGTLDL